MVVPEAVREGTKMADYKGHSRLMAAETSPGQAGSRASDLTLGELPLEGKVQKRIVRAAARGNTGSGCCQRTQGHNPAKMAPFFAATDSQRHTTLGNSARRSFPSRFMILLPHSSISKREVYLYAVLRSKWLFNRPHQKNEPVRLQRQWDQIVLQIEVARPHFGIDKDCPGCHLLGTKPCPFQCVHQKKFSQSLASQRLAYSHPSKKCYRGWTVSFLTSLATRQPGSNAPKACKNQQRSHSPT
jgi:hypothetical protein